MDIAAMDIAAMDEAQVRRARPPDAEALVALWLAFLAEQARLDDRFAPSLDAGQRWRNDFPEWLQDDGRCLVVGERGGEIVGFASAQRWVPPPIYVAAEEVYLDELYVTPAWRGQGLGHRLVRAVETWAERAGAERLRLGALAANTDALAFWERLGGHSFSVTYTIPLRLSPEASSKEPGSRFGF